MDSYVLGGVIIKEEGSALLTSVISILVLILVSGVLFTIALSHVKVETSEERGLIAYHMAEAGIQYGIADVLDRQYGIDDFPAKIDLGDPFGQGGSIIIELTFENQGFFIVRSTATYNDVIRVKEAGYLYEVEESEENTDEEGDDEDDNE